MRLRTAATAFLLATSVSLAVDMPYSMAADEKPMGQSTKANDIFGSKGGYFHPYVSIAENYSDNIRNTRNNTLSDSSTVISPGIWVAAPATKVPLLNLSTSTFAPGGLALSRDKTDYFRRYQTYFLYGADIVKYNDYTDDNSDDHRAEAFLQYNLKGGLSFDLLDQYKKGHDTRGTGISTELDKYDTNLANGVVSYDVSNKFRLRADVSHYMVDYDAVRNNARDREDSSASAYVFFKFMPRTSLFAQYEYINVDYDTDTLSDSDEQHLFAGLKWKGSEKTQGKVKIGYLNKNFDQIGIDNKDDFTMELVGDYIFSPKTSIQLTGIRRVHETTIQTSNYTLAHSANFMYTQHFTPKISGYLGISYANDQYDGPLTIGAQTDERTDDLYSIAPSLQYAPMEWLLVDLSYIYSERDSNFDGFDYEANTVFLRLSAAI